MGEKHNDLTEIITHALNEMKMEPGEKFNPDDVNLAKLESRTGISRANLRRIKKVDFEYYSAASALPQTSVFCDFATLECQC